MSCYSADAEHAPSINPLQFFSLLSGVFHTWRSHSSPTSGTESFTDTAKGPRAPQVGKVQNNIHVQITWAGHTFWRIMLLIDIIPCLQLLFFPPCIKSSWGKRHVHSVIHCQDFIIHRVQTSWLWKSHFQCSSYLNRRKNMQAASVNYKKIGACVNELQQFSLQHFDKSELRSEKQ